MTATPTKAGAKESKAQSKAETQRIDQEVVQLENNIEVQNDRLSADQQDENAVEETEAETPAENIARIGDASLPSREELAAKFDREAKAAARKK